MNEEEKNNNVVEQEVNVASDVVATIAGVAVSKVEGVAKMAGSFTEGLKAIGGKKQSIGIKVESENDELKIYVNIIVKYGVNIQEVAKNIQNAVKTEVENMTGNKVEKVIVNVQGVKIEEEKEQEEAGEAKED